MKILICDDHKIVREGLRQILQRLADEPVVQEASDGNEAISLIKNTVFDIILLDISLPGKSGLDILQEVKSKWPLINVLMLSMYPQEQYAIRALKLGASGYLTKDTASEELLLAVKKISMGGRYISQSLAESIASHLDQDTIRNKHESLSAREFQIMIKLASGESMQEIGNELFISVKTVSTYRSRVMSKLDFTKNTELTKYCMENKLI